MKIKTLFISILSLCIVSLFLNPSVIEAKILNKEMVNKAVLAHGISADFCAINLGDTSTDLSLFFKTKESNTCIGNNEEVRFGQVTLYLHQDAGFASAKAIENVVLFGEDIFRLDSVEFDYYPNTNTGGTFLPGGGNEVIKGLEIVKSSTLHRTDPNLPFGQEMVPNSGMGIHYDLSGNIDGMLFTLAGKAYKLVTINNEVYDKVLVDYTTKLSDPTTNWKTYSFQGGLFKYPPSWSENPVLTRGSGFTQEIKDKEGLYSLTFETLGNYSQLTGKPYATLEEFIGPPPNILETLTIDGQQGGRILPRAGSENKNAIVFFSKDKKTIYIIELVTGSSTLTDTRVTEESVKTGQELFGQILSTFKFLDNGNSYDKAIEILQAISEVQIIKNSIIKLGRKPFFTPEGENGDIVTVSLRESFPDDPHTSRIDTFNVNVKSKVITVEDFVTNKQLSLDEWKKTVKERFQ